MSTRIYFGLPETCTRQQAPLDTSRLPCFGFNFADTTSTAEQEFVLPISNARYPSRAHISGRMGKRRMIMRVLVSLGYYINLKMANDVLLCPSHLSFRQ